MTFNIDDETKLDLKVETAKRKLTISQVLTSLIKDWVNKAKTESIKKDKEGKNK